MLQSIQHSDVQGWYYMCFVMPTPLHPFFGHFWQILSNQSCKK